MLPTEHARFSAPSEFEINSQQYDKLQFIVLL